jgi:hypothetical protein
MNTADQGQNANVVTSKDYIFMNISIAVKIKLVNIQYARHVHIKIHHLQF